jgi:arsenate reductase-like glutaredoxin family protein
MWATGYITRAGRRTLTMEVQVFGVRKSAETRAALRFFAERRIRTHFVNLVERPAARGELLRFAQRFGVAALLDRSSRRFADLGLQAAVYGDERWLELLVAEPLLLRMPLVRCGNELTVGPAEAAWRGWAGR